MTTKAQKLLPPKEPIVRVKLACILIKQRKPDFAVQASTLENMSVEDFKNLKNWIKSNLEQIRGKQKSRTQFSMINEVYNEMYAPQLERDGDGNRVRGEDGKFRQRSFDIGTQKKINRIIKEVEKLLDKYGDFSQDQKTDHVTLKASDAIYLAQRMMQHFNEMDVIGSFIPEAYDSFVDVKAEAQRLLEKGEDNDTNNEGS